MLKTCLFIKRLISVGYLDFTVAHRELANKQKITNCSGNTYPTFNFSFFYALMHKLIEIQDATMTVVFIGQRCSILF